MWKGSERRSRILYPTLDSFWPRPKTGKEIKGFKKGNFNMVVVQKGKRPKII